jgi:uncharacterized protein YprB with RNaseH-like and TPR domain
MSKFQSLSEEKQEDILACIDLYAKDEATLDSLFTKVARLAGVSKSSAREYGLDKAKELRKPKGILERAQANCSMPNQIEDLDRTEEITKALTGEPILDIQTYSTTGAPSASYSVKFTPETSSDYEIKNHNPRILLWDIETTPNLAYVWGKWEQNVIDFVSEWSLLCFAAKWLDEDDVVVKGLIDTGGDERKLVEMLWKLLDEADVVIAHNGDAFDAKKANAKFLQFGLDKPQPYISIDTKKVAKRYFKFNSNKLDDLGKTLGVGRKVVHTGFELWLGCMNNNAESWQTMKAYNVQDVLLLERVYYKLRPYMHNHPNLAVIKEVEDGCPNCGGTDLEKKGFQYTRTGRIRQYQCKDCRAYSKGKHRKITDIR